jgi:hypothetical protein
MMKKRFLPNGRREELSRSQHPSIDDVLDWPVLAQDGNNDVPLAFTLTLEADRLLENAEDFESMRMFGFLPMRG